MSPDYPEDIITYSRTLSKFFLNQSSFNPRYSSQSTISRLVFKGLGQLFSLVYQILLAKSQLLKIWLIFSLALRQKEQSPLIDISTHIILPLVSVFLTNLQTKNCNLGRKLKCHRLFKNLVVGWDSILVLLA